MKVRNPARCLLHFPISLPLEHNNITIITFIIVLGARKSALCDLKSEKTASVLDR